MTEAPAAIMEPFDDNVRSKELMNYILESPDTPEMRLRAIKDALGGKEISESDFKKIEQAIQNQQFNILKMFVQTDGLKADHSEAPEDANFPKTYFELINESCQAGLISEQQKAELISLVLEKNTETTEQKIARIRKDFKTWIQEPANFVHRYIRTQAGKFMNLPGAGVSIQYEREKVEAALTGYLDIWEIKTDGERNEVRVIRRSS